MEIKEIKIGKRSKQIIKNTKKGNGKERNAVQMREIKMGRETQGKRKEEEDEEEEEQKQKKITAAKKRGGNKNRNRENEKLKESKTKIQ